jgi:hypothetical protein
VPTLKNRRDKIIDVILVVLLVGLLVQCKCGALGTTLRYMHLSPAALEAALGLLDGRDPNRVVET